jgi:hypothetical protein
MLLAPELSMLELAGVPAPRSECLGITATTLRFEPARNAADPIDLDWLVVGR